MNHKSTYTLTVRGESVRIEFNRINDSRRLNDYYGNKKPNLFLVKGALICTVEMPLSLAPEWAQTLSRVIFTGASFCTRKDKWNPRHGRHTALADALYYTNSDEALNAEIVAAFTQEEERRMPKPKGPARQPKTAVRKPKPGLRQTLAKLVDLLEKQHAHPLYSIQSTPFAYGQTGSGQPANFSRLFRPEGTAIPVPSPHEFDTTNQKEEK